MSELKDNGGPAFPTTTEHGINSGMPGMTLRDYFAAKAMQGIFSDADVLLAMTAANPDKGEQLAVSAYEVADAMLKERAK